MSSQTDGDPKSGSRSRASRVLLIVLVLVGLVLGFYAEENWRGYRAWKSYAQQLAAAGEPTEAQAFIPPKVPDEENFAMTPALAPLFDFLPGTQHWRDTNAPQLFASISLRYDTAANLIKQNHGTRDNSWVRPRTDLSSWARAFAQGTNRNRRGDESLMTTSVNSKQAATEVLQALSDFAPVLEEVRQASRRPYSRFNLRYEEDNPAAILLPHLAKTKQLCQVLQLRALAQLELGRTDDAQADLDLMFYLSNSTRSEPILISHLVRMAELQLALQPFAEGMGKWSEPQLRKLQQQLQGYDFLSDARRSLQGERVVFGSAIIDYVRRASNKVRVMDFLDGTGNNEDGTQLLSVAPLVSLSPKGWLYLEQRNYHRHFEEQVLPAIDLTNHVIRPAEVRQATAAIAREIQGSPGTKFLHHQLFSGLLLPALAKFSQKAAFAQSAADCAVVACSLERYRLAKGHFPENLQELVPQFIEALPHDVITGKPLAYHREDESRYVLYSVGWNERDDEGTIQQGKNGAVEQNEGDWVWGNVL